MRRRGGVVAGGGRSSVGPWSGRAAVRCGSRCCAVRCRRRSAVGVRIRGRSGSSAGRRSVVRRLRLVARVVARSLRRSTRQPNRKQGTQGEQSEKNVRSQPESEP